LWWCPAAGDTWQQLLATDGIGTGGLTFGEGVTPASPAIGEDTLFFDSSDHKVKYVNSGATLAVVAVVGRNGDYSAAQITHAVADNGNATMTGYYDLSSGALRWPETTIPLPAASSNTGRVYLATNGAASGDCATGAGTSKVACRSNGSSWDCVGNCYTSSGSGVPGGNVGDIQKNAGTGNFSAAVAGTDYYKPGSALAHADLPSIDKTRQSGYIHGADGGTALTDGQTQGTIFSNQLGGGLHVTKVWCDADAGSPVVRLKKNGASANLLASDLTCSTTGASSASFNSGEDAYADGARMDFTLVTASTAKRVTLYVRYTVD
jgi:hypothetical protein